MLIGTRGSEIYEIKSEDDYTCLLQGHYDGELWGLAVNPTNSQYVTCGGDKTIRIWDATKNTMLKGTDPFKKDLRALDWANDGSFIIAGDMKGKIHLLDPETLEVRHVL